MEKQLNLFNLEPETEEKKESFWERRVGLLGLYVLTIAVIGVVVFMFAVLPEPAGTSDREDNRVWTTLTPDEFCEDMYVPIRMAAGVWIERGETPEAHRDVMEALQEVATEKYGYMSMGTLKTYMNHCGGG